MKISNGTLCLLLLLMIEYISAINQPLTNLRVQHLLEPTIDIAKPLLSWTHTKTNSRYVVQEIYEVQISLSQDFEKLIWESAKVKSSLSQIHTANGISWMSDTTYFWRVRWSSNVDETFSSWSISHFNVGILKPNDWQGASWLSCKSVRACLQLRKEFEIPNGINITRSILYFSAIGWGEVRINGQKLGGNAVLEPAWTQWNRRFLYTAYNVPFGLLKIGRNAVGGWIGNGWPGHLGHRAALRVLLSIERSDGTKQWVTTDSNSWKGSSGPISADDIYNGETYDARKETPGWDLPNFDDSKWDATAVVSEPLFSQAQLSSQMMEPIRALELLSVRDITQPIKGVFVVDVGQNTAGWARLTIPSCPTGTQIKLRHAEFLNPDGTIYVGNLRAAKATDYYTCKGSVPTEIYEPRFTYHGFRYIEISGYPLDTGPSKSNVAARVVHSAVQTTGFLIFGDGRKGHKGWPMLNSLQSNIRWVQLTNLHSVPTDCDQRNERQGWMADASVSSEQAMHNFDMSSFYNKWLTDMVDVQSTPASLFNDCNKGNPIYPDCNGTVTDTVPHFPGTYGNRPADPSWGAAYPLVYRYLYRYYGDFELAEARYVGVRDYIDFLHRVAEKTGNLVRFHWYGDWLEPQKVASSESVSQMTSAFNYLYGLKIIIEMATELGDKYKTDVTKYTQIFQQGAIAYNTRWFNEHAGYYGAGTQAEQVYPLFLQIVPSNSSSIALKKLIDDIITDKNTHLDTGIISTKWIFPLFSRVQRSDVGLAVLLQTTDPSWGFMIANNATTIWEHWNAISNPSGPNMNSRDHPAFSSIGAWMYQAIAGIHLDVNDIDFNNNKKKEIAIKRIILAMDPVLVDSPSLPSVGAVVGGRCKSESSCTEGSIIEPIIGGIAFSWHITSNNSKSFIASKPFTGIPVDAGWKLVRRVNPGNKWHPATDHLQGTDVYDDKNGTFSVKYYDGDHGAPLYDQFLFTTNDLQKWLIVDRSELVYNATQHQPHNATIIKSSISPITYKALWYHRNPRTNPEDPWASLVDHNVSIVRGDILYGEGSYSGPQASNVLPMHGGASVYIRKKSEVILHMNATVPISSIAELRIPTPYAAATAANVLVLESNHVVWQKGAFVKGVSGLISGHIDSIGRVCLEIGSGSYQFVVITVK